MRLLVQLTELRESKQKNSNQKLFNLFQGVYLFCENSLDSLNSAHPQKLEMHCTQTNTHTHTHIKLHIYIFKSKNRNTHDSSTHFSSKKKSINYIFCFCFFVIIIEQFEFDSVVLRDAKKEEKEKPTSGTKWQTKTI